MQVEGKMEIFPVYFNLIPKPDKLITMGENHELNLTGDYRGRKTLNKVISPRILTEQRVTTMVGFILRTNNGLV